MRGSSDVSGGRGDREGEVRARLDWLIDRWGRRSEAGWRWFLENRLPGIIESPVHAGLPNDEYEAVKRLQGFLSEDEWSALAVLLHQRRPGRIAERRLEVQELGRRSRERQERERMEREERERERIELAERERERKEREERERQERALERREQERREHERLMHDLRLRFQAALESDFLNADKALGGDPYAHLVEEDERQDLRIRFVQEWTASTLREGQGLDADQAAAVAAADGNVQVIARAGSGKTRTLVTRAIFLQKHCGIAPNAMLLLAFNRKAADEMRRRLEEELGDDIPHVMTFHALAHAIVHPEQELISDDKAANHPKVSRQVRAVIDEYIETDANEKFVHDLMLSYFRDDIQADENDETSLTPSEEIRRLRELPMESLDGKYVKSFGEKLIANTLFENGIEYRYEFLHKWNGANYRPDFTINGGDARVVIEYFGLSGRPDYDEQAERKRQYWKNRSGWDLVEVTPQDISTRGPEVFARNLIVQLRSMGVPTRRRSEDEIWRLTRRPSIDRFTESMTTFVGRCRSQSLDSAALRARIAQHRTSSRAESRFLALGVEILDRYARRLAAQDSEDFNGLVSRAVDALASGSFEFSRDQQREQGDIRCLSHVMVDEAQDLSPLFFGLLDAIRSATKTVGFFFVGDDWQAINGFAGSDLRYFDNFEAHFGDVSLHSIPTNYRSARQIVRVSNELMRGRGGRSSVIGTAKRSDAGRAILCDLDGFEPSATERDRHGTNQLMPAALRVVHSFLDDGRDVVVLSRTNKVAWWLNKSDDGSASSTASLDQFLDSLRSWLPDPMRGRVTGSTVHTFKGLEQAAVVILDATEQRYPLIRPTWCFFRIVGDDLRSLNDEERRLFYVGLTRAEESLAVLTEGHRRSPFLDEIGRGAFAMASWTEFKAPLDGTRLEIRVFDAFDVKEQLKAREYRWVAGGKYWSKSVAAEGFSFGELIAQPWRQGKVSVEVLCDGVVIDRAPDSVDGA